jgi:hypothetical protein
LRYEKPVVVDYGSIASHTFMNPAGNYKQAEGVYHLDWMGETSAGSGEDREGTHPNK